MLALALASASIFRSFFSSNLQQERKFRKTSCTVITFGSSHLSVAVVTGVGSQDAADLHIWEPLLQHFHHVPNAQLSTDSYPVEHLEPCKEAKI